jgi:hypothetical protein
LIVLGCVFLSLHSTISFKLTPMPLLYHGCSHSNEVTLTKCIAQIHSSSSSSWGRERGLGHGNQTSPNYWCPLAISHFCSNTVALKPCSIQVTCGR